LKRELLSLREDEFELVEASGNVFRDLGDPHADLKQANAIVAARIIAVLDERALTVRKAEELTGFAAADFSRIRNADLGRFTLDRLMKMLAALDGSMRVTLHVAKRRGGEAVMAITADV
jgi:predicted XRE-type DNA-binding protein